MFVLSLCLFSHNVLGEELIFQYCLIDLKATLLALEEYVAHPKLCTPEEQETFLHRLVSSAPQCFHPQLWTVYLNFVMDKETASDNFVLGTVPVVSFAG